MMLKTEEVFQYLKCEKCHTLSLLEVPQDMAQYYPKHYYSYNGSIPKNSTLEPLKYLLRCSAMRGRLGCGNIVDTLVSKLKQTAYIWLKNDMIDVESHILDVGCGNGFLLKDMQKYGFKHLIGIDLYAKEEIYEKNLHILKKDITILDKNQYDLIMYHHSFEHIINPHQELNLLYNKLKDGGTLLIRIPLCDSYAFRKYQEYWVQLDAPRHIFLHTIKSMHLLAKRHHFRIDDIVYDSTSFQFTGSECYLQNLSMGEYSKIFTSKELKILDKKSKELNNLHDGDSACFYLKKMEKNAKH